MKKVFQVIEDGCHFFQVFFNCFVLAWQAARNEHELARLSTQLCSTLERLHNAGSEISLPFRFHSTLRRLSDSRGEISKLHRRYLTGSHLHNVVSSRLYSTIWRLPHPRGNLDILLEVTSLIEIVFIGKFLAFSPKWWLWWLFVVCSWLVSWFLKLITFFPYVHCA